ncbi:hypothetical protein CcaCcLH18_13228 [Colletotrichum camelliae]|nr:hypothetical protein CcaCcLH18_13228 [Colletotrichum camelliae]
MTITLRQRLLDSHKRQQTTINHSFSHRQLRLAVGRSRHLFSATSTYCLDVRCSVPYTCLAGYGSLVDPPLLPCALPILSMVDVESPNAPTKRLGIPLPTLEGSPCRPAASASPYRPTQNCPFW